MLTVGTMQLHQPQAPDAMEPFFVGGEYHVDISRLSSHDHSGGLLGAPVAVTIPDGSITTADLDPSVLAPYALTDGSKPFTGEVTMQADAIIRDALRFGEQGTALAPDATLSRTGAGALRADTNLGVGVNPVSAWAANWRAIQVGERGAVFSPATGSGLLRVAENTYTDGAADRAIATGAASFLDQSGGAFAFRNAPSVAAGAAQTFTTRMSLAATGTLSLAPDAGQGAVAVPALGLTLGPGGTAGSSRLAVPNTFPLELYGWQVIPGGTDGAIPLGEPAHKWTAVYAVAGAINTSSREHKEGITPLDPARAIEAVRNTEVVTFDYVAPTRGLEWYDLPDDPEQAEQVLQQRLTAAPLEAAARHQAGFISEEADELFLVGEGQTSPGNSVGVLLAALQHIDQRLSALEGA